MNLGWVQKYPMPSIRGPHMQQMAPRPATEPEASDNSDSTPLYLSPLPSQLLPLFVAPYQDLAFIS